MKTVGRLACKDVLRFIVVLLALAAGAVLLTGCGPASAEVDYYRNAEHPQNADLKITLEFPDLPKEILWVSYEEIMVNPNEDWEGRPPGSYLGKELDTAFYTQGKHKWQFARSLADPDLYELTLREALLEVDQWGMEGTGECPFKSVTLKGFIDAEWDDSDFSLPSDAKAEFPCKLDLPREVGEREQESEAPAESQVAEGEVSSGQGEVEVEQEAPETGSATTEGEQEEEGESEVEQETPVQVENEDDVCAPLRGPGILDSKVFDGGFLCGNAYLKRVDDGRLFVVLRYAVSDVTVPFGPLEEWRGLSYSAAIQPDNLSTGELGVSDSSVSSGDCHRGPRVWPEHYDEIPEGWLEDEILVTFWVFRVEYRKCNRTDCEKAIGVDMDDVRSIDGLKTTGRGPEFCYPNCTLSQDVPYLYRYQMVLQAP